MHFALKYQILALTLLNDITLEMLLDANAKICHFIQKIFFNAMSYLMLNNGFSTFMKKY